LCPLLIAILQIELKAEDLYDKEKVDLETILIEDVFKLLQCGDNGLDDTEAKRRFEIFGPNKLEQEDQNAFLQVCLFRLTRSRVWCHNP
jgi:H+-transporting ATPase